MILNNAEFNIVIALNTLNDYFCSRKAFGVILYY